MAETTCGSGQHTIDESLAFCPFCGASAPTAGFGAEVGVGGSQEKEQSPAAINLAQGYSPETVQIEHAQKLTNSVIEDRYHIVRPIAEGGMGKIFLAQERHSGRFVALKVIGHHLLNSEPIVQQFIREAVITARLQHPSIIPVYELGFLERHQLYYTMRYVDGKSLREAMTRQSRIERLSALRSAMSAVHYAHGQGLWHRDLKPENILLGSFGEVYVLDWGLVSVQPGHRYQLQIPNILIDGSSVHLPDDLLEKTSDAITETGTQGIMGTLPYMAPEQLSKDARVMGARSDIWAFGIMLWEMLCDQHPLGNWWDLSKLEIAQQILRNDIPPPSQRANGVPRDLDSLCIRMLSKDTSQRLPFLSEAVEILGQHLRATENTFVPVENKTGPMPGIVSEGGRVGQQSSGYSTPMGYTTPLATGPIVTNQNTNADLAVLRLENSRLQRKVSLLTELSQLSPFDSTRRAQIVSELIQL